MIKDIFLPEKIGNYYLFSKRIIGIDIGKTYIQATKVYLQGRTVTIEKIDREKLPSNTGNSRDEKIQSALDTLCRRLAPFDAIHSAIPSSTVIFRELKLPFVDRDKIDLIINFEIEKLIPFSIKDAICDFVIAKKIPEENSSIILAAIVQKSEILHHTSLFEHVDSTLNVITIDILSLYSLYRETLQQDDSNKNIVILDLGFQSTHVLFVEKDQPRMIRSIPQGIATIAKAISEKTDDSASNVIEQIIRFGFTKNDSPEYATALKEASNAFWKAIDFTLTSFAQESHYQDSISKILLFGDGATIQEVAESAQSALQVPCEIFDTELFSHIPTMRFKDIQTIPLSNIVSTSVALPSAWMKDFNLLKGETQIGQRGLFFKQIFVFLILTITLFSAVIINYILYTQRLSKEIVSSEKEVTSDLKKQFKKIPREEENLEEVIDLAQQEVEKDRETWLAFSSTSQSRFLQYLLELTNKIDKDSLGFVVEKITIAEGTITMTAQVKNHDALKILERELRKSSLFSYVEPQDNPNFTMKILLAPIDEE